MGKAGLPVSPLAPARFPDLPVIAGVDFASAAAGIKYQGRSDVTLIRIAPGSTVAGSANPSGGWLIKARMPIISSGAVSPSARAMPMIVPVRMPGSASGRTWWNTT